MNGVVFLCTAIQHFSHTGLTGQEFYHLLLFANSAMIISQIMFSNIIYDHYQTVDKVLKQVTKLMTLFAIVYVLALHASRWLLGTYVPAATLQLQIAVLTYIAILMTRVVEHFMMKAIRSRGRNTRSVLFVGNAQMIKDMISNIDVMPATGLRMKGYYSDDRIEEEEEEEELPLPYLGTPKEFVAMISGSTERIADDIYCALPAIETEMVSCILDYAVTNTVHFYYVPTFLYTFGAYLTPQMVGEQFVFSNLEEPLRDPGNRALKRLFDILVSGTACLFILPLVPIIWLIIKTQSPGPLFFKQARTGLDGKEFMCYKFRSMHVNKDADKLQATKNDPRKFAFGNFMRKTNIDELPQFFNVLRGDMSIVGPRPHMLAHTEEYRSKIHEYMLRHIVRPGITGWAQTTGYRGETKELWQMRGRVDRDIWYIQNWSIWLDIRIIFRTAMQIVKHDEHAY